MSKLEELINQLCPNGVEYKNLEDCCNILDRFRKPITKSARVTGIYPYYGANGIQDYVAEYIFDGTFILVGEDGSVVTPMGTPVVQWADGKLWVNNHAHIIEAVDGTLLRYLFHYLQTVDIRELIHGNIPKLNQGDFRKIQIALPPLPIQEEIVRILDNMTSLTAELTAELTARQKQYEYYRDSLLSFEEGNAQDGVRWMKLGEVLTISRGIRVVRAQLNSEGRYPVYQNALAPLGYFDSYNCDADKTFVISAGAAGEIGYCYSNFWAADDCYYFNCSEKGLIERYLYYVLLSQQHKLLKMVRKASIPRLGRSALENLLIPIHPLEEQQRIVDTLDRFDKLCNDISEGLPAEIEARKKQYEYYRNKLLTFKEKEA